jgi:citrate lyase beta subunit
LPLLRVLQLASPHLQGLVLPKVDSAKDVQLVEQFIHEYALDEVKSKLRIIASIESPMALLNLREVSFDSFVRRVAKNAHTTCTHSTDRYELSSDIFPSSESIALCALR